MESENVAFDQAMLKVLLIEFMRSTKTPMKIANDHKFRAIFKFLRPDLIVPTSEELLEMNTLEHQKFAAWGRIKNQVNDGLSKERIKMAVKYSSDVATSSQSTSSAYKGITLASILASTEDDEMREERKVSEKIDNLTEEKEEEKVSTLDELNALFAPPPAPKKRRTTNNSLPCLVCQSKTSSKSTKTLTKNSGLIVIFLCVTEGVYDMETACELAKNSKFLVCEEHFEQILENAQHHLDVVDPSIDVHSDNQKILEAYHVINKIKGFKDHPSNRKKYILIFVNYVSVFFDHFMGEEKEADSKDE